MINQVQKVLLFLLVVISYRTAFAQNKTIYKDTINISGYVYYDNGKPALGTKVISRNKDLIYDHDRIGSIVDEKGYFMLKGANPQDTLILSGPYPYQRYPNHGARYLIITLPTPLPKALMQQQIVAVTHINKKLKRQTRFSIEPYPEPKNETFGGYMQLAEFPGGIDRFYKYINANLKYPDAAIEAGIEGTVQVRFTIAKDGTVKNVTLISGIGHDCDELLIDIVKRSRKWNPSKFCGKGIDTEYSIAVEFKLDVK